ncbi:ScbR family autoregulator-binding transcription factor [Streptomyces sp. LHD-70]|uniref:ScbR family autoregulator-binding transcription factor n=1 Tax=Streptomyces sp. LHD-70 TaxID=3072140 RepID=UPI00280D84FF|nr:ScbR family autoregulator-binding transcription factor [Streptomyces sp. LHD-70]MDQ8707216.1 ScbR family autoregulator-binding transcription factor [Streptomyces sp. LHD-70]
MAGQPKQQRAVKTRDDILYAAAVTFDELGYKGASMREIMRRAGVTLGAVYFHFDNKEELASAVILSQTGELTTNLHSEGAQRMVDFSMVWAHQLNVSPLIRAAVRLAVEQRAIGIRDDASFGDFEAIFQTWLEAAREEGELAPGVDPAVVAEFLVGAFTGVQHYAQLSDALDTLPDRVVSMWHLLLPGIVTRECLDRLVIDPARGRVDVPPPGGDSAA